MGDTSAQWQALRSRLPPSSEGVAGGQTSHQRLAAMLLFASPLVLAAALVQRYLWRQGLGLFLHCCRCRVQQALAPGQPRHSRGGSSSSGSGSSPQGSCGSADLQQLLEPVAAVAGIVSVPAWLTAAAACAGVAAALASLGSATLLLVPRQVCGAWGDASEPGTLLLRGRQSMTLPCTAQLRHSSPCTPPGSSLSPSLPQVVPALGWALAYECTAVGLVALYSAFLSACHWHGRDGTTAAATANGLRRPWGASIVLFATILFSLGLVPWWPALLG